MSFKTRYLAGEFDAFFGVAPGDKAAALGLDRPGDRRSLVAALARYATSLGAPEAVCTSLQRLEHPESRVVVTGQQAGLLLGPTYTLSKAVSAIKLARELDSDERPVVPIFWLASQDADSAEIDHAHVLDLSERLTRLSLPLPAGVPAGKIAMEPAWVEAIAQRLGALDFPRAHLTEGIELLSRAAEAGRSVADWMAAILYALLGREGLVVLNPLEKDVALLFREVLFRELDDPLASTQAIVRAGEKLAELGERPQLGRSAGASNLFLEEDGQRALLRFDGEAFTSAKGRYTRDELKARFDEDPTCLTPAAGLRPVAQDAVLPTAAVVVGDGELRYFAQLREVYAHHGVAMPLIWPRAQVTVLEPPVQRILEKFSLDVRELQADFEGARTRVLLELHGHGEAFEAARRALAAQLEALLRHVRAIDPTLARSVARAETRIRNQLTLLERKSGRALSERDEIYARQFGRLERHLLPNGMPQERVLSPFSHILKFGAQHVVEAFLTLPASGEVALKL
jgi:bacillithiol biosynthesis cysteine-adding enzyme BshC